MNTHKHKCPSCGNVWEHPDECHSDFAAHICPCGDVVTEVCRDEDEIVTHEHPVQHCVSDVPVERDQELARLLARLVVISAIIDLVNESDNE